MKIECTVEELKELMKKETPVAITADVSTIDGKKITTYLEEHQNLQAIN